LFWDYVFIGSANNREKIVYIPLLHIAPYPVIGDKKGKTKPKERRNLFLCPACNKVWQIFKSHSIRIDWEYLWSGFPKRQPEKICPYCSKIGEINK